MMIKLHQVDINGNSPIFISAEEVQAVQWSREINYFKSILTLRGGTIISVMETPIMVLTELSKVLPKKWSEGT